MEQNNEIFDTILIGKNPSIFMSSIYIQTYNMKQLLIKEETEESCCFKGHDLIPGVFDVESKDQLIEKLEKQCENLGVLSIEEKVESISFDSVFIIKTEKNCYSAKTVIVDSKKYKIEKEGCFYSLENVQTENALEMLANGCKVSFAVREYVKK
ncbi:hypothetical protein NGRA_0398 [Nosema granulosis]|uniref:Uncharacterized protein n=1 Tax=Nosema granulosis TaxID=83296 RepID=A0A9P6L0D4_9MICR|nr:hypothetical protein NGRA_0398 [Nosema granulosis]